MASHREMSQPTWICGLELLQLPKLGAYVWGKLRGVVLGWRRRLLFVVFRLGIFRGLRIASSFRRRASLVTGRTSIFSIAVLRCLVIRRRFWSVCAAGLVVVYDEGGFEDGWVQVRCAIVLLGDILALFLGPGFPGSRCGAVAPRDGRRLPRAARVAPCASLFVGCLLAGLLLGDDPVERALQALKHDGRGGRVSQEDVVGLMQG